VIEYGRSKPPRSTGPEWLKQIVDQSVVVEGIAEIPVRRVSAAPVTNRTRVGEAIHGRSDDGSAVALDGRDEFVRDSRFPSAVDAGSHRMREIDFGDD